QSFCRAGCSVGRHLDVYRVQKQARARRGVDRLTVDIRADALMLAVVVGVPQRPVHFLAMAFAAEVEYFAVRGMGGPHGEGGRFGIGGAGTWQSGGERAEDRAGERSATGGQSPRPRCLSHRVSSALWFSSSDCR